MSTAITAQPETTYAPEPTDVSITSLDRAAYALARGYKLVGFTGTRLHATFVFRDPDGSLAWANATWLTAEVNVVKFMKAKRTLQAELDQVFGRREGK